LKYVTDVLRNRRHSARNSVGAIDRPRSGDSPETGGSETLTRPVSDIASRRGEPLPRAARLFADGRPRSRRLSAPHRDGDNTGFTLDRRSPARPLAVASGSSSPVLPAGLPEPAAVQPRTRMIAACRPACAWISAVHTLSSWYQCNSCCKFRCTNSPSAAPADCLPSGCAAPPRTERSGRQSGNR